MKTSIVLGVSFVAALAVHAAPATAPSAPQPSSSSTFQPVLLSSWSLYYGGYRTNLANRLAANLVVIDPAALGAKADEVIAALKARGCRVAGYLSCLEVAEWHRYKAEAKDEWRIKVDGENWVPWGKNEAVSLAVPEWREKLVALMQSEVFAHGCDGVFMDTLADIDNPKLPEEERVRQLDGLGKFAAAFDEAYPDKFFIANWTLQRTLPVLAPHVDAVCWEDFAPRHFENAGTRAWMEGIAKRVGAERAKHPFAVLTLWNSDTPGGDGDALRKAQDDMRRISAEHGYVPYCTSGGYNHLP